jgi:hypothetical protein
VAEGVVDVLEAVEVEQQDRDVAAGARGLLERPVALGAQLPAVRQAGEQVVFGLPLAFPALGGAAVHDVDRGQQAQQQPGVMHRHADDQRGQADHRGRGAGLAPAVPVQLEAEGHAAHDRHAEPDEHVVDHDHDDGGQQQRGDAGRFERVRGGDEVAVPVGQHVEQQAADGVGDRLLGDVEGQPGQAVPPAELGDQHGEGLREDRVLPAVHGVDRGGEGEAEAGPVVLPAREHRAGLADHDQRHQQPHRGGRHAHVGDLEGGPVQLGDGRADQGEDARADDRGQIGTGAQRRVGPERPPASHLTHHFPR